jgi:fumarylpyruvate hydrolase
MPSHNQSAADSSAAGAEYVISPPPLPVLPVDGSTAVFPIRRVYCIGRNYAAHAVEMGHDPDKEPPFFFLKAADNVVSDGRFPYPPGSSDVHHEIELVVALNDGGRDIASDRALDCVYGYGVGLDMTRRDLQGEMKKLGRPWEIGKSFEASAPCGPLVPAERIGHPDSGAVWLKVNGALRQEGDLNQMIWKVPDMIAYLSGLFELSAGDIIMTGTPAGVGAVNRGDRLHGHVDGVGDLQVEVV